MDKTCLTPSIASDLNRSAKSQNLTQAKKNKNTSVTNQQLLQLQIVQLKQKAHQSFMQVIQIQQLHQEEMQSFRQEYNTKCDQYESKISLLNERIVKFQQQKLMVQRNYKHHLYQMQKDNLFSNIQPINFQQESKLDDSSILNFQEIIQTGCFNQKINAIKQEIAIQILSIHDKPISQRIMSMLQKLFQFMAHLNKQFINLHQVHMKLKNQHQLSNNMKNNPVISLVKVEDQFKSENKNIKMDYENMQKQNKLFSDKLKRVSSDKMKIQKLLRQKEKKSIQLQDCLHKMVNYMHAKGIKIEPSLNFDISMLMGVNEDKSLDLNQFIQEELIKKTSLQSNRIEVGVIKRLRNNRN